MTKRIKAMLWWDNIDPKVQFIYLLEAKEKELIPSFVTSANITGRLIEIIYKNRGND